MSPMQLNDTTAQLRVELERAQIEIARLRARNTELLAALMQAGAIANAAIAIAKAERK